MQEHLTWQQKFDEFHADNPHVWPLFVRFAVEMIEAGHKVLSTTLIINRIRWETAVTTDDRHSTFKINTNYAAYYGRLFMRKFPNLPGFRTRELRSV